MIPDIQIDKIIPLLELSCFVFIIIILLIIINKVRNFGNDKSNTYDEPTWIPSALRNTITKISPTKTMNAHLTMDSSPENDDYDEWLRELSEEDVAKLDKDDTSAYNKLKGK